VVVRRLRTVPPEEAVSDWLGKLTPDERARWEAFVEHFRRDALQKIAGSAAFVALASGGDLDVKFAMELGAAILLDKPVVVVAQPGTPLPAKLRAIADRVVFVDVDTEAGRTELTQALRGLVT
jgi:hypothetical protein